MMPGGGGRNEPSARARAEHVARTSYGRLLAILAASNRDIELAEDCLGDAFERALATWPERGVPDNPEGWLLTVARNRRRDVLKSAAVRATTSLGQPGADIVSGEEPARVRAHASESILDDFDPDAIPDRRLALLFVCAHPAIAPEMRAPLMLQTVLGFDARRIAEAFAIQPSAMAQRLVRAKRRIRGARIPFVVPDRSRLPERLDAVLEAIYGAYALDWNLVSGTTVRESVAFEAHYFAVTLATLLEDEPEAHGLAALISLSLARLDARGGSDDFVPLEEQDPARWDGGLIGLGERHLRRAHALGRVGRFQLEAAIQSVHCARAASGVTDWSALRKLYDALVTVAPTLGARVARAAVLAEVDGPRAGLSALESIDDPALRRFQPAWATRAHLLAAAGRKSEAAGAYAKAISLTTVASVRRYLERRAWEVRTGRTPRLAR